MSDIKSNKMNFAAIEGKQIHLTMIFDIIKSGHLQTLKNLMNKGLKLWNCDSEKEKKNPLFYAIKYDRIEFVKFFIEKGVNINDSDIHELTPLHYALSGIYPDRAYVSRCNIEIVKILIKNGASFDNMLIYAVKNSNVETIKFLIENGEDISQRNEENITPFIAALDRRDFDIVDLLIKKGVNLLQRDEKNMSMFMHYIHIMHNERLEYSKGNYGVDYYDDDIVQIEDDFKILKLLIDKGANINDRDYNKEKALMLFVKMRDRKFVSFLINNGACRDELVLSIAVQEKYYDKYILRLLL